MSDAGHLFTIALIVTGASARGDATDDGSLRAAGIDRAAGLVAVAGDDATNNVVTLSARRDRDQLAVARREAGDRRPVTPEPAGRGPR
jgi:voltage-gated potassium channel